MKEDDDLLLRTLIYEHDRDVEEGKILPYDEKMEDVPPFMRSKMKQIEDKTEDKLLEKAVEQFNHTCVSRGKELSEVWRERIRKIEDPYTMLEELVDARSLGWFDLNQEYYRQLSKELWKQIEHVLTLRDKCTTCNDPVPGVIWPCYIGDDGDNAERAWVVACHECNVFKSDLEAARHLCKLEPSLSWDVDEELEEEQPYIEHISFADARTKSTEIKERMHGQEEGYGAGEEPAGEDDVEQ